MQHRFGWVVNASNHKCAHEHYVHEQLPELVPVPQEFSYLTEQELRNK